MRARIKYIYIYLVIGNKKQLRPAIRDGAIARKRHRDIPVETLSEEISYPSVIFYARSFAGETFDLYKQALQDLRNESVG